MKKIVLFVTMICLTGSISGVLAQQQRPSEEERRARFEQFNAEREAFISEAMKLTDDEKKAFWSLCNELQMKKFELNRTLREELRKISRARRENQTVSEADYKKIIELSAQVKLQEAQLEQEYQTKFLQVISAEKVFLYRQSEQSFVERMIRERTRAQQLSNKDRMQAQKDKMQAQREKQKERMQGDKERMQAHKERMQTQKEGQTDKIKAQSERERQHRHYRGI